jgi:hypothetical protein
VHFQIAISVKISALTNEGRRRNIMKTHGNGHRGSKIIGVGLICSVLFALIGIAAAQGESESPIDVLDRAKAFHAKLLPGVKPADKTWINEQAKKIGLGQMDEAALRSAIELRCQKQGAKPDAMDSMELLVLVQAIPFTDREIAQTQATLQGIKEEIYRLGVTIEGTKALLDDIKGRLDGMNELSEMTSLRLQMTMDRRSKFIETLSNIMKKIGTTADTQTQNIK